MILSPIERLQHTLQAWFPEPEFTTQVETDFAALGCKVSVGHRTLGRAVHTLIDMNPNIKIDLTTHHMENIARSMYHDLAIQQRGEPPHWCSSPVGALLQLMGLEVRLQTCQGTLGEQGILTYLIKPKVWAEQIKLKTLDNSLEWWQIFVQAQLLRYAA